MAFKKFHYGSHKIKIIICSYISKCIRYDYSQCFSLRRLLLVFYMVPDFYLWENYLSINVFLSYRSESKINDPGLIPVSLKSIIIGFV